MAYMFFNAGASKIHCPKKPKDEGEAPYNRPTTSDESDDDDGDGHDTRGGRTREVKEPDRDVKEPAPELRRSQRVVIPSSVLKSPWIEPKRKSKGKRTYDEKDTLFEMCTKSVPRDEVWRNLWICITTSSQGKSYNVRLHEVGLTTRTYYRMQHEKENPTLKTTKKKKKTVLDKSKDLMANKVRNHFLDILRTLKPELLQDDHKIPKDVTWAKVHVQPDT
ncbi:hypothetical protein K1719_026167 [Acacia pycnantha]|nr:hypothetical protein K1719_026167 [Acacia pycnantha]